MTGDVDEIGDEVVGVEPVVVEDVAAQRLGRDEPPVGADFTAHGPGQSRADVAGRLLQLVGEVLLALHERALRLDEFLL